MIFVYTLIIIAHVSILVGGDMKKETKTEYQQNRNAFSNTWIISQVMQ